MSLRCPHCLAPIPQKSTRCAICGELTTSAPPEPPPDALRLAPGIAAATPMPARQPVMLRWWLLVGSAVVLASLVLLGLIALGLAGTAVGLGEVVWPALLSIGGVLVIAGLLQAERRRRQLAALLTPPADAPALSSLELIHLFAARFAAPAHGSGAFWPPLAAAPVSADEAAWRAGAATLLDLAEREVVEMEPRVVPATNGSVTVMGIRLVRPVPAGDAFAAHLLHPLARHGVGTSATVSDLISQHLMAQRQPARALLDSVRAHLTALGYYRPPGIHPRGAPAWLATLPGDWLSAALLRPVRPVPTRIAQAQPALTALDERLAAWDAHEAEQVRILRHELCAGFLRARARVRHMGA